jgi:hypothetical protein
LVKSLWKLLLKFWLSRKIMSFFTTSCRFYKKISGSALAENHYYAIRTHLIFYDLSLKLRFFLGIFMFITYIFGACYIRTNWRQTSWFRCSWALKEMKSSIFKNFSTRSNKPDKQKQRLSRNVYHLTWRYYFVYGCSFGRNFLNYFCCLVGQTPMTRLRPRFRWSTI